MTKTITDADFTKEVLESEKLVIVDFWAPWCGPCRQLGPIIDEISKEVGESVKVFKMNVDESRETASKYGVQSVPTLMLFKEGAPFSTKIGVSPKNIILDWIKEHE